MYNCEENLQDLSMIIRDETNLNKIGLSTRNNILKY